MRIHRKIREEEINVEVSADFEGHKNQLLNQLRLQNTI